MLSSTHHERLMRRMPSNRQRGENVDQASRSSRRLVALAGLAALVLSAAQATLGRASAQDEDPNEISTRESEPTFRLEVQRNLVLVRAVVRDQKRRPVRGLTKDDFRLFDRGKPQAITHFSMELPAEAAPAPLEVTDEEEEAEFLPETSSSAIPLRYLALYFDDVHMKFEDIARTRQAAERYLASSLTASDRVGIFTSSGQHALDFTDDLGKLQEALQKLLPRDIVSVPENVCPQVDEYQAYLILHQNDPFAIEIAVEEAMQCSLFDSSFDESFARANAETRARQEAIRALNRFQLQTEYALRGLTQLARRIAILPGQRNIVLISPGFLMVLKEHEVNRLIERALRAGVVINTLDAKGLYAPMPLGDVSKRVSVLPTQAALVGRKMQFALAEQARNSDVLRTLAYDTGGELFHNSNDYDEGFRRVGGFPEVYYLLGFSPQNLKLDGKFHPLTVKLLAKGDFTVQARKGYYAPRELEDPTKQAQEEIEQAVFSREEVKELPMEIQTQFFKFNDLDARLSILTRLDLRFVRFRKENGRNLNNLRLVTALFDRDGKFLTGKEKTIEFRLLDPSLERLARSGISAKTSFDVTPGTYLVRQVIRDSEGAQISALNRTVEIPF